MKKMEGSVLAVKGIAYVNLALAISPAFLVYGCFAFQDRPFIWYAFPLLALIWGFLACLWGGKKRAAAALSGLIPLGALAFFTLRDKGLLAIPPVMLGGVMLALMPAAFSTPTWEEFHPAVYGGGIVLHLFGQIVKGRDGYAVLEAPLSVAFACLVLLTLVTWNRQNLRTGQYGSQKTPPAIARRNRRLVLAVFIPALILACLKPLGQALTAAWEQIKRWIGAALQWLLSRGGGKEDVLPGSGDRGDPGDMFGMLGGGEASDLAILLEKIFKIVGYALVAAVICFVLWKLGKKFKRLLELLMERWRRYAAVGGEDYVDEAESTLHLDEKAQAFREKWKNVRARVRLRPWQELDGRARVRRLYQQVILRGKAGNAMTAREAITKEKSLSESQAMQFAELYDRARYSDYAIAPETADDLRKDVEKSIGRRE